MYAARGYSIEQGAQKDGNGLRSQLPSTSSIKPLFAPERLGLQMSADFLVPEEKVPTLCFGSQELTCTNGGVHVCVSVLASEFTGINKLRLGRHYDPQPRRSTGVIACGFSGVHQA